MRVLFAGSPGIAVPALKAAAENCTLAGLLTNPDSPKGRSSRPEPTECAAAAQQYPCPVLKPEKLDSEARTLVADLRPDLLISFAYGKIFGPKFLALFPLGGINIHPSLLPKYRGPTPIPAAIINRESVTGITIQKLATEMDSGDIIVQQTVPLSGHETTESLSNLMAIKAAELLPDVLKGIAAGTLAAQPQDHNAATYCSLISKEDGLIDWNKSAAEIEARIRAFDPWPLCWTMHGDLPLFILKAGVLEGTNIFLDTNRAAAPGQVLGKDRNCGILIQTGEGILTVGKLQYQAKKALEWNDFLNGARHFIDAKLGTCGNVESCGCPEQR
ncbi:MAG: methionyl-tRNA formyltransferase [Treponema sp.]|nr:methionyl-tRNA formyltransferase [Treponema sp.]